MEELYVDTPEALDDLCTRLDGSEWVALDTEFLRESTYYPQLCLLQVATDRVAACVDPLAVEEIRPLIELLARPEITVVLHAARQDLEIFFHRWDLLPGPVFDTQIAATVLGYGDQVGYGNLVKAMLEVGLEKAHSRTDWTQRPLDQDQIRYALDDVRYLGEVYRLQLEMLERKGRLHWIDEDLAELTEPATYRTDARQAWRRLKGAGRLKGMQLAVLQELADWREREAMQSDRPRRWLVKDEPMLDLARHMPGEPGQIERIRGIDSGTVRRYGRAIVDAIARGKARPRAEWPEPPQPARLAPEHEAVADAMMALLRLRCSEEGVSPAAVAARRDIEALLRGERDIPLLHGWRRTLVGSELLAFFAGERRLVVRDGSLVIDSA